MYSIVPENVKKNADRYIVSKVGADFFEQYIFFNPERCKQIKPNYLVYYKLVMPQHDYVNEDIYFTVDFTGDVVNYYEIVGIPDCSEDPSLCDFKLTETEARKIAIEKELPLGVRQWDMSFRWSGELNRYIWHIISTVSESGSDQNYKASGVEMMISPADGSILKHREWNIY
jgi:hypothetical protein